MSIQLSSKDPHRVQITEKASATLPQTAQGALFNVNNGRVKIHDICGEVTVVIQTQANNTKLVSNPTVGADVDICAVNDITADAVGTMYNITGTFADAMVATTSGAHVSQAAETIISAGTIDLNCAASNSGETKWAVRWSPVDEGATVTSA